jgi:two-component system response regulator YesN
MKTVMLIDKDRDALSHLLTMADWSSRGYEIKAVYSNASIALKEAGVICPFLVITDLCDSQNPGLQFVEALRLCLPDALIAILTTLDEVSCICAAYRYGVLRYLLKPAKVGDILELLDAADGYASSEDEADSLPQGLLGKEGLGRQLQKYVDTRYGESSLSLHALADTFHLNYSYASSLFRRQTGENYTSYVGRLRVNHAKRLLAETARPMSEIAKRTGFRNAQVFYYAFKKATGVTPKEYRGAHFKR